MTYLVLQIIALFYEAFFVHFKLIELLLLLDRIVVVVFCFDCLRHGVLQLFLLTRHHTLASLELLRLFVLFGAFVHFCFSGRQNAQHLLRFQLTHVF